jgi:hypothetical protein
MSLVSLFVDNSHRPRMYRYRLKKWGIKKREGRQSSDTVRVGSGDLNPELAAVQEAHRYTNAMWQSNEMSDTWMHDDILDDTLTVSFDDTSLPEMHPDVGTSKYLLDRDSPSTTLNGGSTSSLLPTASVAFLQAINTMW